MDASAVDDLLDFSDPHHCINSYDDFSISAPIDTPHHSSYNHQFPPPPSSFIHDTHPHFLSSPPPDFTDCLCSIPNADVEELEWLSKFVDDSFTDYHDEDGASLILASTTTTTRAAAYSTHNQNASSFIKSGNNNNNNNNSKPILMQPQQHHRFTPTTSTTVTSTMTTSSNETDKSSSSSKSISRRHYSYSASPISARSSGGVEISSSPSSSTRRCTHCASEKTPQWRSGPLGPKTLCNACGVRYKSGRLVPEYRPAGSPTFVLTQHSNSHRKVLELRRQKQVSQGQAYRQQDFEVC